MAFHYGVIEGLYDQENQWSWESRNAYASFCAKKGFNFYIYAPKNDPYLREQWNQPWPEQDFHHLNTLGLSLKQNNVRFGIGLTPFNVRELNHKSRQQLQQKIASINQLNPQILSILFDDFSNDIDDLAKTQADIAKFIAAESTATQFIVAGTYYSKDPLLQRVYGTMPKGYWSDLGQYLDPQFDIFWTGDHVISLGYDQPGLQEMTDQFQRKPFLWDNYPVNDTEWLKHRLRLYTFTGRPWQISDWCRGHAVNPMIQPRLSMIPLATLADLYQQQDRFDGHASFRKAVVDLCGQSLASAIEDNLLYFTEEGTLNFSGFTRKRLENTFSVFQSETAQPYVREILTWLQSGEKC
ncbi:beta-N-acetylglucosaminidase domain-containing protein [Endozoicomonas sp. GU-1]|uniref:beta-N-acetylglucosaminidase domain-containing protein n=1 Tax=Endozoicomonas sp. GU-1 TaxID=3009078 RepID=UPI0022B5CB12|nr:beta-N-acetylglucosaminidase domain-containing protein [Endozoicomonas sp. GU-1]WBA85558.1 beta-N-acetylglucosaminidase domain-containing protein [Endozoicomonas sp. GU-1]